MSQTNTPNPDEDTGEFAGFDTIDAICAYTYHKEGEEGLRWLLDKTFDPNDVPESAYEGGGPKESLEDAAAELERRGLDKPAAILRDHAKDCRSGFEMVPDYIVRARPGFVKQWRNNWLWHRQKQLGISDRELKRRYPETARQSETTTEKPASHKD